MCKIQSKFAKLSNFLYENITKLLKFSDGCMEYGIGWSIITIIITIIIVFIRVKEVLFDISKYLIDDP